MSNRITILNALVKHGVCTYDTLEANTDIPRKACRANRRTADQGSCLEDHRRRPGKNLQQHARSEAGKSRNPRQESSLEEPQAESVGNLTGNSASENRGVGATPSPESAIVAETQTGNQAPESANDAEPIVSYEQAEDGKQPSAKFPLHLAIDLDGTLTMDHARYSATEVVLIKNFLLDTEPVWSRHA